MGILNHWDPHIHISEEKLHEGCTRVPERMFWAAGQLRDWERMRWAFGQLELHFQFISHAGQAGAAVKPGRPRTDFQKASSILQLTATKSRKILKICSMPLIPDLAIEVQGSGNIYDP